MCCTVYSHQVDKNPLVANGVFLIFFVFGCLSLSVLGFCLKDILLPINFSIVCLYKVIELSSHLPTLKGHLLI